MSIDAYEVLGIHPQATSAQIKSAYRELVKVHHPDTGGDEEQMLAVNAAWELLRDPEQRQAYNTKRKLKNSFSTETQQRSARNARASAAASAAKNQSAEAEDLLVKWLKEVYQPIDKLLGQIINPLPKEIVALSADPYDDLLMEAFCKYIERSQDRLEKVEKLYMSKPAPISANGFGLSLYHCFSQVKDAVAELDRYTMGYVDSYLHDGREMLREAKRRRLFLKEECRRLKMP